MGLLRIRAEAEYKALNVGSVNDRWKQFADHPRIQDFCQSLGFIIEGV